MTATDHGKRKRQLPASSSSRHADEIEGSSEIDGAESCSKKPKVIGQVSDTGPNQRRDVEDLATENERLQKQLDKAIEELERCQKEREKEREIMLGIIDRLTKQ